MSRSGHVMVALLTAFFALLVYATPQIAAQEYLDYRENSSMDLGAGYDFMGRTIKRSAIKDTEKASAGKGLTGETTLQYIETSSEMSQQLHVGSEGTYSSALFSVSAKADFVRDVQVNEYSLNFMLYSRYAKSSEFFKRPELTDEAKALLEKKDFDTFRRCYGDYYISSITKGGEFICLLQIHTSDEKEKTEIAEQIGAEGVTWSAHEDLQSKISKHLSSKSMTVKFKVFGVEGFKEPQSMAEMMEFGKTFNQLVSSAGNPIKIELRSYSDFPEFSGTINSLDSDSRGALLKLTDNYMDYRMLLNNVDYILNAQTTGEFDWRDAQTKNHVREVQATLKEKLRKMESLGSDIVNGRIHYNDPQLKIEPWYSYEKTLGLPNRIMHISIPDVKVYPLKHKDGDHEMFGHNPRIRVDAEVKTKENGQLLYVDVDVDMKEDRADWTHFSKSSSADILDLKHHGLKVLDYWPKEGSIRDNGDDSDKWRKYSGKGIIHNATCRTDVKGLEDDKIGADPVTFEELNIILVPVEEGKPLKAKLASSGIETRGTANALKARVDSTREFWFKDVPQPAEK